MRVIGRLQQAVVALTLRSDRAQGVATERRALAMLLRGLRRGRAALALDLSGLRSMAERHREEVSTWVGPDALERGEGGPFDACDLRCWLALARRAGVPAIPAREVLRLSESDMAALSGLVQAPGDDPGDHPVPSEEDAAALGDVADALVEVVGRTSPVDPEDLRERLAAAMDDVPEGWMVRSARCGSSTLKSLSGMGLAGPVAPEVRFGPEVEVGPGWRRVGNRRMVDAADARTREVYAEGPGGDLAFLARPWARPARLVRCDDPNRAPTPIAGPGWWPLEFRCYVVGGVVEGVSSYFSWLPLEADPANARLMLEARALAQRVADEAVAQRALPRYMDLEFARASTHPSIRDDARQQAMLAEFGRDEVAFTLDLLEVEGPTGPRLVVLEGGPGATPHGGGHTTGFSGVGGPPLRGTRPRTEGAAFSSMPHVVIADMTTWRDGDATGRILTWAEVEALAAGGASGRAAT